MPCGSLPSWPRRRGLGSVATKLPGHPRVAAGDRRLDRGLRRRVGLDLSGREPRDVRLDAGEQLLALLQLLPDAFDLTAALPHKPLRGALVGGEQRAAPPQLALRADDRRATRSCRSGSRVHERQLIDKLLEVRRGEQRVQRRDVAVLVESHGAAHQRAARDVQLESSDAPCPFVLADLGARRRPGRWWPGRRPAPPARYARPARRSGRPARAPSGGRAAVRRRSRGQPLSRPPGPTRAGRQT